MHDFQLRRLTLPIALLLLAACEETPPDPPAPIDAGTVDASRDAGPEPDAGAPPIDAGPDCGPHGDPHLGHCHCHTGYVEEAGRCVPIAACAGDDPLEPDDRFRDAVAWEGEPLERWLCPGDVDHVTVTLSAGETLTATATFVHAELDLALALWDPGADPRFDGAAARTTGSGDEERLVYRAGADGPHLIRIHASGAGQQGAYRLELTTDAP